MRFNAAFSVQKNLVNLVNSKAQYPFPEDALSFGNPSAITPGAGNGNKNTQITATAAGSYGLIGSTTYHYNRSTLPNVRPLLGPQSNIDNTFTTHAAVQAFLAQRYGLAQAEVIFTNPIRVPIGGEELVYKLNPIANSKVYIPGEYAISVRNRSPMRNVDPVILFGATQTIDGNQAHSMETTLATARTWARFGSDQKQNLMNMINAFLAKPDLFKPEYVSLSTPVAGGNASSTAQRASVVMTPQDNALTQAKTYSYLREILNGRTFTGVSSTILSRPYMEMVTEWFKAMNVPMDGVQILAATAGQPNRVNFTVPAGHLLFVPVTAGSFTLAA